MRMRKKLVKRKESPCGILTILRKLPKSNNMAPHETSALNPSVIAGLGNPGNTYRHTYHNTGFLFLDFLIKKDEEEAAKQIKTIEEKFFAYTRRGNTCLVWPLTFMNESGAPIAHALRYLKAKPDRLLIVHDDSDIELGKYKVSFGRNAAGHHGIESIIQKLKTKDFWRLRIGIRPKSNAARAKKREKAMAFVMKKISDRDRALLKTAFEKAAEELKL